MEDKSTTIDDQILRSARFRRQRCRAAEIIAQHTAVNMAIASVPVPFSDSPLILLSQGAMLLRIMYTYRVQRILGSLVGLFSAMGAPIFSSLAIMVAGNLLKLFPGVGTIGGGILNAFTAGSFTVSLGLATAAICEKVIELTAEGREKELEDYLRDFDYHFGNAIRDALRQGRRNRFDDTMDEWA